MRAELTGRQRFNAFLESFAGPRAASPAAGLSILLLLSVGTAFGDLKQNPDSQLMWNGLGFQSFLLSATWFLVGGLLLQWIAPRFGRFRIFSVAALFVSTEVLRAVFVGWMAYELELSPEVYWPYRIVAGGCTGLVLLGIGSVIANDAARYRSEFRDVRLREAEAEAAMALTQTEFTNQRADLLRQVREAVTAALHAVLDKARQPDDQLNTVVHELMTVSDEVIRPLSHDLFDMSVRQQAASTTHSSSIRLGAVFRLATLERPFDAPVAVATAFLLLIGAALFSFGDPVPGLIGTAAVLVWVWFVLSFLDKRGTPYLRSRGTAQRSVLFSVWILLFAIPPIAAVFVVGELQLPRDTPFLIYTIVLAELLAWSYAIYQGMLGARAEVLTVAQKSVDRLMWANARLGAQLWRDQAQIAKVLHHDVQGAVIAAALSLQNAISTGANADEALDTVRSVLNDAANFTLTPEQPTALRRHIQELNNRWNGLLELSVDVETDDERLIEADDICLRCVNDFVTEFATNSVKHGRASEGSITLRVDSPEKVRLVMSNNGVPFTASGNRGLGRRLAETQTIAYGSDNIPSGGIRVWADLSLSTDPIT